MNFCWVQSAESEHLTQIPHGLRAPIVWGSGPCWQPASLHRVHAESMRSLHILCGLARNRWGTVKTSDWHEKSGARMQSKIYKPPCKLPCITISLSSLMMETLPFHLWISSTFWSIQLSEMRLSWASGQYATSRRVMILSSRPLIEQITWISPLPWMSSFSPFFWILTIVPWVGTSFENVDMSLHI